MPGAACEPVLSDLVLRCSTCHALERVNRLKMSRFDWEKLLREMQQNAGEAILTNRDCEVIVNYLVTTRGT